MDFLGVELSTVEPRLSVPQLLGFLDYRRIPIVTDSPRK